MKGIVYTGEKGAEVLDGLEVRDPGPGEVIVKIMAAGVCHSDITAAAGLFNWPAPAVLGHEGAGIVEQVGTGVTNVVVGDHVIISTLAACGMCKACGAGKPTRCRQTLGNMTQPFTLNGDACWNFAGASVFTERTVVKAIQAVAEGVGGLRHRTRRKYQAGTRRQDKALPVHLHLCTSLTNAQDAGPERPDG